MLTPYHHAVGAEAEFSFVLRGYWGSSHAAWEHEVGRVRHGEQRAVRLSDLDLPEPPEEGGVLEVESVRLDAAPSPKGAKYITMWIDAQGVEGGGYLVPTIPIRGAAKQVARDDLQVIPGIVSSSEDETELVLLNPLNAPVEVRLVGASIEGLVAESRPFVVEPCSAWHGRLSRSVPGLRRLLAGNEGLGSLAIYSSAKILPYFGIRRSGRPLSSLDHTAPIFA